MPTQLPQLASKEGTMALHAAHHLHAEVLQYGGRLKDGPLGLGQPAGDSGLN